MMAWRGLATGGIGSSGGELWKGYAFSAATCGLLWIAWTNT